MKGSNGLRTILLGTLKEKMSQKGVSAYIVPKNDEFMSSYVPKEKDRLYKLTNFTGSNGLAIVFSNSVVDPATLKGKRPVFITDSRYKLQSANEIDQELFEI